MLQPTSKCVWQQLLMLTSQTWVNRHPGLLQRRLQYTPGLTYSCCSCNKDLLPLSLLLLLLLLLLLHHTLYIALYWVNLHCCCCCCWRPPTLRVPT
jgi:hypothetical protein